jgi:hypothetical protein
MRRQQESWKKVECIQGEEEQIAEVTSKYSKPYTVVVVFSTLL